MKATVSEKGQVTIPKRLRDQRGVLDLGASSDQFLDELRGPRPS